MIDNFSTLLGRVDDFDGGRVVLRRHPRRRLRLRRGGALSSDGSFDTRQRGSNSSISMLEPAKSSEAINISFDASLRDKS
ncbi:hypothetical protein PR003_g21533 [Phytophthora rubi]|uniref:Uncharacterized protein n=1 Tax=Phytophthora rubi TaxID=129364 RepID=A0A6A4DBC1_9STRA|nr:hypothetical protein PR001_g20667 [Phytophthora rubi]KAE9305310.1 hypothetical protein PR003_g21533 [Phytophthora rubi]